MSAVLLGANDPPQKIQVGNYTLEASYLKPRVLPGHPTAAAFSQRGGHFHCDRT